MQCWWLTCHHIMASRLQTLIFRHTGLSKYIITMACLFLLCLFLIMTSLHFNTHKRAETHCHACTGLDSSNASRVVDILSGLASAGVTVIITIHQPRPDILRLMDRMLLLSGNGQVPDPPALLLFSFNQVQSSSLLTSAVPGWMCMSVASCKLRLASRAGVSRLTSV